VRGERLATRIHPLGILKSAPNTILDHGCWVVARTTLGGFQMMTVCVEDDVMCREKRVLSMFRRALVGLEKEGAKTSESSSV